MGLRRKDVANCMTAKELALAILALPEEQQCLPFTYDDNSRYPVTVKGTTPELVAVNKDCYAEDDASKGVTCLLRVGYSYGAS